MPGEQIFQLNFLPILGKIKTKTACDKVYNTGFGFPEGCTQLDGDMGGGYLVPEACRAKCDANPACKLWQTEGYDNSDTPWCLNFGDYKDYEDEIANGNGCHDASFEDAVIPVTFSGLSGCNSSPRCDKVYKTGFGFPPSGCTELGGDWSGWYFPPEECKAHCDATPTCKLWESMMINDNDPNWTPLCNGYRDSDFRFGQGNGCHGASFGVEHKRFSGLSGCLV